MKSDNATDRELQTLLGNVVAKAKRYGSRSEQVRNFVQMREDNKEFVELAATLIIIFETDRQRLDGMTLKSDIMEDDDRVNLPILRKEVKS